MDKSYKISRMSQNEVQVAIDWMHKEGWDPGLNDAACFYAADHNGFFVGKLNGDIIAVASAIIYDENFAFCGCYVVKPEYRNKGYGLQMTKARLDYVGDRVTGLDGVLEMVDQYAKIGYKPVHNNLRYALTHSISTPPHPNVVAIGEKNIANIMSYDRNYFPASRKDFLNCWLKPKNGKALAYIENHVIKGYGVIRKCFEGYKIGPLFAESPSYAEVLFLQLANGLNEFPIYLDIPKPNKDALNLVESYKMSPIFETIRMYRCGEPNLNLENIYGITTFELG